MIAVLMFTLAASTAEPDATAPQAVDAEAIDAGADVPESDDVPVVIIPAAAPEPAAAPAAAAPRGPKVPPPESAIARDSTVSQPAARRRGFGRQRPGSRQRFAIEFKIGPYLPEVDSRYTGSGFGPYATIFGRTNSNGETIKKPRLGVMPVLAFEWQIVYLGGPLGIGTQVGFFRDKAKALVADPVAGENLRSNADKVTFGMVPLAVLAIYRLELFADFYHVPIVPYVKGGVAYTFWWAKDGTKKVAVNAQGEKGRGGVVGWQLNPGVMLRLDFIERNSAKKLDTSTGINHTYLFGEFQFSRMRNFGVGNAIDLGDKTFFGGLAMEF